MLDPHRLVQRWKGLSDEDMVAQRLNSYLGPDWPAPPRSADQAATIDLCKGMALEVTHPSPPKAAHVPTGWFR